jgi:hypothetical protein
MLWRHFPFKDKACAQGTCQLGVWPGLASFVDIAQTALQRGGHANVDHKRGSYLHIVFLCTRCGALFQSTRAQCFQF